MNPALAVGELSGTTVTIGSFLEAGLVPLEQSLQPIKNNAGITIELIAYGDDYEQVIPTVIASGLKLDILFIAQPGLVADLLGRVEIWLVDPYVYGGTAAINTENIFESHVHLFAEPSECYLLQMGSFAPFVFSEEASSEEDYDVLYLPPIDPRYGRPVLGSGDLAIMLDDRPEVREVMRYLATGDSVRYLVEEGLFISPHKNARFEWYGLPSQLKSAQILLEADTYRFDASDLMPPEVGMGTFWQGVVDWVDGDDLETILREIDASWPDEE